MVTIDSNLDCIVEWLMRHWQWHLSQSCAFLNIPWHSQRVHVVWNDSAVFPWNNKSKEFAKCYANNFIRHPSLVSSIFLNVFVFLFSNRIFVVIAIRRLYNKRTKVKFDAGQSLRSLIDQSQDIVNNRHLLTTENINILVNKINTCNRADALKLLGIFKEYRYDSSQHATITQIWQLLRKREGFLQYDHYNQMLSYYSKAGLTNEAQEMFDEMMKICSTPTQ